MTHNFAEPLLPQFAEAPPLLHDEVEAGRPFPMTATQQALWIGRSNAVDLGSVGCYGYFEWDHDTLDIPRLTAAWNALLVRHPMLRTVSLPDGTQRVRERVPEYVIELRRGADLERVRTELSNVVFPTGSWPQFTLSASELPTGGTRLHFGFDLQTFDAGSLFQVLFPDLLALYNGHDLEPLDITFRDYTLWRERHLADTASYRAAREYWLDRVDDLPAAPDLPTLASREKAPRFIREGIQLDPSRWAILRERARGAGVSPDLLLVAAFAEVMRTWAKNPTFTINFPIFDRLPVHPQVDRLLGDFTNTLLLAVEKSDGTFGDRVTALGAQLARDLEHRFFTGVEVLRELTRSRGGAVRASMPIVVTSLLSASGGRSVADLGREVYSISQTPQVLLDFQIREIDGALRLNWDVLDGAFPEGMIEAAFTAYTRLVDRIVDDPAVFEVDHFDLMPPAQRALIAAVNDTASPVAEVTLHELLFAQADARPEAEAVVDGRRRLSYGELADHARRVAHGLRADGVAPGDLVAIVMDKGWEQYAAVYGVLAAGAAYLPIDAAVPPERLAKLLELGAVSRVLSQSWLMPQIPDDRVWYAVDRDFSAQPERGPSLGTPADLAYVIFTSGSTGEPKGVAVDHRGVVNMITDVNRRFSIGPGDRAFGVSGLHFDASIYDVFGVIAAGATVVLPRPYERAEPDAWCELIAAERVTAWNSVPVLMELLVGQAELLAEPVLRTLRLAVLSGDWIPLDLPDRIRALAPVTVVGSGGPTETICWSLFYPIGDVDPAWTSIPYGKPISNQQYYIVDTHRHQRPIWVPGEMAVASSVGLARGYWRDEARTSQKFVTLPETAQRAYLTGDLGRYLPDGNIEILGRDDFQVKIQGYRIELGEIEAALRAVPHVASAVVVAPRGDNGARHLHAFVVGAVTADALTTALTAKLPGYLVPAAITVLDALPLTRNGKIDRLTLIGWAGQRDADDAAMTALESVISAAVAEVLGLDQVGPADNFFRLGGDSLTGTRLAGRLRELLGVAVPVRVVFSAPVISDLATSLAEDPAAVKAAEGLMTLIETAA